MPHPARSFLLLNVSILTAISLEACSVAHDAASATYHAVTAPVRIIKRQVARRLLPGTRVETRTTTVANRTVRTIAPTAGSRPAATAAATQTHHTMKPVSSI